MDIKAIRQEIERIVTESHGPYSLSTKTADDLNKISEALLRIAAEKVHTENLLEECYQSIDFKLCNRRRLEKDLYRHLRKLGRNVY